MSTCLPCQSIDCDFPSDLELYSLQGLQFFLNGQLYPVIFCPTGYNCNPGVSGSIYFQCCSQTLSRPINSGMSYTQIQSLVQSMFVECQGRNCSDMPPFPVSPVFYFNAQQIISGSCMSAGGTQSLFVSTAPSGMFVGISQAIANAMALAYAQSNYHQPCCIQSPKMQGNAGWCCLGADLDFTPELNTYLVTGPNSAADYTFTVTGNLPPGTTLDKATHNSAILGGVPTTPGFYMFTVKAARTNLPTIYTQVSDTFAVFGITNLTGAGTVGTAFSQQLATDGGTLPVTFSANPASLPAGLTMDSTGLITGTPLAATSTPFNVTITDADGGVCTQAVTITVTSVGIDWTTLVWGALVNTCGPAKVPSGVLAGNSFSFSASGGSSSCLPGDAGSPCAGYWVGSLTYNGPAVLANIHALMSITGSAGSNVQVFQDGNPIGFCSGTLLGTDCPFTVADTGGIPSSITVQVFCSAGAFLGSPGTVVGSGTIT